MSKSLVLLVEDDEELQSLVCQRLEESGYEVISALTGPDALTAVRQRIPDLVLLDIMLPDLDGLEVCRQLRAEYPLLYIIMLTARTSEMDRVVGLEVGADDYITKPFGLGELVARVRSALRRIRLTQEQQEESSDTRRIIELDGLSIDLVRRRVVSQGDDVQLTVLEYDLLVFLADNPDRPFTRMQLLDKVWNIQYEGYDRTVDSHIQRLRAKIEVDASNPTFIKTVWGVGYRFNVEADS
jgi:two-component system, OmpR family, alkaline phosphatase synthesis response regulator PhoP